MATIASLDVNLTMGTGAFAAGAKKATKQLGTLRVSVSSLSGKVTALSTSFLAVRAAANSMISGTIGATKSFAAMFHATAESIDNTGKLAGKIGTTTQALGELQYAAKLSGVESEGLSTALQRMTQSVGQAMSGGGAARFFDELGLNVGELARQDAGRTFKQIADAISRLPTSAQQSATAIGIFGKQGSDLLPVLRLGREELLRLGDEARRFGVAFSDGSFARVEAANDSLTRFSSLLEGVRNSIVIAVAPDVELATDKLTMMGEQGVTSANAIREAFHEVALEFATIIDTYADFRDSLKTGTNKVVSFLASTTSATAMNNVARRNGAKRDSIGAMFAQEMQRTAAEMESQINSRVPLRERLEKFFEESNQRAAELEARMAARPRPSMPTVSRADIAPSAAAKPAIKAAVDPILERILSAVETPAQKLRRELADIDRLTGRVSSGPRGDKVTSGPLSFEQSQLARLMARRDFLSTLPQRQADLGAQRPAALERGTAAAFSASFGPVQQPLEKLVKIEEQILRVMRRIENREVATFPL